MRAHHSKHMKLCIRCGQVVQDFPNSCISQVSCAHTTLYLIVHIKHVLVFALNLFFTKTCENQTSSVGPLWFCVLVLSLLSLKSVCRSTNESVLRSLLNLTSICCSTNESNGHCLPDVRRLSPPLPYHHHHCRSSPSCCCGLCCNFQPHRTSIFLRLPSSML